MPYQYSESRLARLVIAFVALLALAGCSVPASATSTPTAGTTSPTARPAPADTDQPILGDSESAFAAKYGPPNDDSMPPLFYAFQRYSGSTQDYLTVGLDVLDPAPLNQLANYIALVRPPGQPWSMSAATALCMTFAPRDAIHVSDVQVVTAHGGIIGVDILYTSAAMANTFPAERFRDANQNQTTRGSFDVQYEYPYDHDPSKVDTCSIEVGWQQTK